MKNRTIGTIVKSARILRTLSLHDLAKRVKVTPGYISHIERDDPVHLSERLAKCLEKELKITARRITNLMWQHNVHALRYDRTRRKKAS